MYQSILSLALLIPLAVHAPSAGASDCPDSPSMPGYVNVLGAVEQPAAFEAPNALPVLEVLQRTGGLRADGYALGSILIRPTHGSTAPPMGDLQNAVAALQIAMSTESADSSWLTATVKTLVGSAQVMRVPILAIPSALRARPHLEPSLLPGDVLIIPSRPRHVAVIGRVEVPGLYEYNAGRSARDYIHEAGGFAKGAARTRTVAVGPGGEVREQRVEHWNYRVDTVLPGTVILVPGRTGLEGVLGNLRDIAVATAEVSCAE